MLLQYTADEVIGIHTPALLHAEEEVIARGKELTEYFGRTIEGFNVFVEMEAPFESREWTYIRKDGSAFPVQLVVTAIRNSNGEVKGFLGVATDISKLKKAEKEMQLLLDFSTDQNKRLKNFAYIVSHNLRSHAGNIHMLLDLYIRKHPEAAENEIISHIKTASASLKETISNLNEVVTINNLVDQNLASINLQNAIEQAVDNVRQLAINADVIITSKVSKSISIEGLPAYIDSILLNFLTNGIKYRSPDRKGQIELSAVLKDNFVILSISDNGLGIDLTKNRDKLFGMYKTFHNNKDARGIGLFITKNQVEAMGGKIEVESEVNVGTLFKIYLKHEKN
jgi:PAS domain S-box-containing protein